MKRKHILSVLLILLAVLIVAGIAAGVAASVYLSYYLPRVMDAQEKRINIVRYIGLCQTDEFYDEVMSMPDGYIRLSDLKTPLAKATGERPKNRELLNGEFLVLSVSSGMIGPGQLRPHSEFIYVKKEGRFLCVAATTFLPERYLLKPWLGWKAMRFEWIPEEGDPHGLEEERRKLVEAGVLPEDGRIIRTEDWDIDPYEFFKHGIRFYPPPARFRVGGDGFMVASDGVLNVYGGKLTGKMTFETGAYVIAQQGAIFDFDLTQTTAGADALVNNLAPALATDFDYTLTVSGSEAMGTYKLAENAAGFNKTITVVNTSGVTLGTLTVDGGTQTLGGRDYTLTLTDGGALGVTLGAGAPAVDLTGDLGSSFTLTSDMVANSVNILAFSA